jgi:hypothetical protein
VSRDRRGTARTSRTADLRQRWATRAAGVGGDVGRLRATLDSDAGHVVARGLATDRDAVLPTAMLPGFGYLGNTRAADLDLMITDSARWLAPAWPLSGRVHLHANTREGQVAT